MCVDLLVMVPSLQGTTHLPTWLHNEKERESLGITVTPPTHGEKGMAHFESFIIFTTVAPPTHGEKGLAHFESFHVFTDLTVMDPELLLRFQPTGM